MPMFQTQAETLTAPSGARAQLRHLWSRLVQMHRAHQERQTLCRLDDRELRDFGANRLDAQNEARRRFWDLPPMA